MVAARAVTGCAGGHGAEHARFPRARSDRGISFDLRGPGAKLDEAMFLDPNDRTAIRTAGRSLSSRLDGLCNNAGGLPRSGTGSVILQVNFVGTWMSSVEIPPRRKPSASIADIAGRAGHGGEDRLEQVWRFMAVKSRDQLEWFVQGAGRIRSEPRIFRKRPCLPGVPRPRYS